MRRILWQRVEWQAVLGRHAGESSGGDEFVVRTEEQKAEALPLLADMLQEGQYTVVVDAAACEAEEARVREIRSHAKIMGFTEFDMSWAKTGRLSSAQPNLSNARCRPALKTETDTPEMEARVLRAFMHVETMANGDPYLESEVQADFEHGQWWVTVKPTGAQWSVQDGEGPSTTDGFCFERVTEGEGDE